MKGKNIKIFSIICLIISLLSNILPIVSLAAGGRGTFEVYNISSNIRTTVNNEEWGITSKKIHDSTTNKWKTAFCVELRSRIIYGE